MQRKVTNRFLALLVLVCAATILAPTTARAQQKVAPPPVTTAPATAQPAPPPVTTAPANAQTATSGGELQKITVTGYIIPRIGDGPQPVTTLDQDFISKQADQTVSDVLQRFPESTGAFNPITTTGNSSSPGSVAVGLKDLPYNATLVLVNGIRFPDYPFAIGGLVSFVDLNSFPLASIDRIEILKDGGSATYGSDAVAGVVNLVLKSEYQGADVSYYWGITQSGDYEVNHLQFTAGIDQKFSDTSKLSLVTTFDFYDQTPIEAADRPYTANLEHSLLSPKYPNQARFSHR